MSETIGTECLTTCHHCRSTNTVWGQPEGRDESLCRDCGQWFTPLDHPLGCFYGSFAGAYPDVWHVVRGNGCDLPHGDEVAYFGAADPKEGAA